MGKFLRSIFLLLALYVAVPLVIFAGGGRISIEATPQGDVSVGSGFEVKALMYKDGGSTELSVGENAEFRVRDPRSGDHCDTQSGGSDANGYIHGGCYATQAGTVTIYVRSLDKNDDSNDYELHFVDAPVATSTPVPTSGPTTPTLSVAKSLTPKPKVTQATNVDNGLVFGEGDTPTPTPKVIVEDSTFDKKNLVFFIIEGVLLMAIGVVGGYMLWENKPWKKKKTTP